MKQQHTSGQVPLRTLLQQVRKGSLHKDHVLHYLQLEEAIITSNIGYTKDSLRAMVKNTFNTSWFPPRLKLVFEQKNPEQLVIAEVILEAILQRMNQSDVRQVFDDTLMESIPRGIYLDGNAIDLRSFESELFTHEIEESLQMVYKLIRELEKKEKSVCIDAMRAVADTHSAFPFFFDALQKFPAGVLDSERNELLAPHGAARTVHLALQLIGGSKASSTAINLQTKAEQVSTLGIQEQAEAYFTLYREIEHFVAEEHPQNTSVEQLREEIVNQISLPQLPPPFELLFLGPHEQLLHLTDEFVQDFVTRSTMAGKVDLKNIATNIAKILPLLAFEGMHMSIPKTLLNIQAIPDNKQAQNLQETVGEYIQLYYKKATDILSAQQAQNSLKGSYNALQQRYLSLSHLLFPLLPDEVLSEKERESLLQDAYKLFVEGILEQITQDTIRDSLLMEFKHLKQFTNKFERQQAFSILFYEFAAHTKRTLGSEGTERLFKSSYSNLQRQYAAYPIFQEILHTVPRGILDVERFDILSSEELKKISTALKKTEIMKSQFTNIAAHELKTPLIPILGYAELIASEKKYSRAKLQRWGKIIYESAVREQKLVDDLLAISKLEAGEMKFAMKPVNVSHLINSVVAELLPVAKTRQLTLKKLIAKNIPIVRGDEVRLTQLVGNLLNNALKFTEKGSVTIRATVLRNSVQVSITDTGMGISSDDIPKLFVKFYQTQDYLTRKTRGTGLGLAISKHIVDAHRGRIWVESKGGGSTFFFTLPIPTKKLHALPELVKTNVKN